MTKGTAAMLEYTTKECSYNSTVIVHQHGGYDVTCKPRLVDHFYQPRSQGSLLTLAGENGQPKLY